MTQLPATSGSFPVHLDTDDLGPVGTSDTRSDNRAEAVLRHYWRIFYKRRWIIAAALGLGLAAGLIATLLMPREYTSAVTLEVSRDAPNIIDIQQVDQSDSQSPDLEFYQTQYALLKSRSLSEAVVRDMGLADNYLYLAGNNQAGEDDIRRMSLQDRLNLATKLVNDNTVVAPVRGSRIITVEFTSPDAELSAKVANSIAQNFIESNLSRHFEAAAYARDFLQKQLNQVRSRLEDSERKAVFYAQQQGLIKFRTGSDDNASEQSLLASQLAEFSSQLTVAHAQRAQAEAQYREGIGASSAEQSLNSTALNSLREQRAELIAQQTKLQSDFGPQYPPLIALRAQIGELDRQINREESRVNSSVSEDLQGKYEQAVATENALQRKVDALKAAMIGEEGRSIQYNILQRDVDTNRALYDALLQRFKDVGVAGGVGSNNVAIVDEPIVPDHASSPKLPLNLALGLTLGLLLGGALALMLEQLAESIVLPAEFQDKLRIPLLGTTPAVRKQSTTIRLLPKLGIDERQPHRGGDEESSGPPTQRSDVSEAYLSIVAALRFSTVHGAPKSICITSTQEKEGKTTSAVAIARTLASTGSKVLLIDADMRKPALQRIFDESDRRGLSEVLTAHAKFEEVVHETDQDGLSLVTAGKIPPNPAELLSGHVFGELISQAAHHFEHVVVDCPPLLGLADAPLVSRAVEATVFVIESNRTRSTEARHALDRLFAVHARVIGAILTKLDQRNAGYGYGHTYTYKYGGA